MLKNRMIARTGYLLLASVLLAACIPAPLPPPPLPAPTVARETPTAKPAVPSPSPIAIATLVATPKGMPRTEVPLAAMFLSWYGFDSTGKCPGGLGSFHWNSGPNTGGVVAKPVRGYYCSADPGVISWQLGLLEDIGVRALFVSWWGWGDSRLNGTVKPASDTYINDGITALLKGMASRKSKIKMAIIVEPFTLTQAGLHPADLTAQQHRSIRDWLWDHYYNNGAFRDRMFQWEGKPLLIAFDPMRLPADPRYTIRLWTGRGRSPERVGEGWQWFFGPPQDVVEGMSHDGVAFVYPRFDEAPAKRMGADYITWEPRSIDPLLQEGAYEQQWRKLAANRAKVKMVVLYGWNLYGEQAHIEPSWGDPAPVGDRYVRGTKEYYAAFLEGLSLLPAR